MTAPLFEVTDPASEVYVKLALYVINMPGGTVADLRWWWNDERGRRKDAGLTPEQTEVLIAACRTKSAEIESGVVAERPKSRPAPLPSPDLMRRQTASSAAPTKPAARKKTPQLSLI